jgi:hypothetical protein
MTNRFNFRSEKPVVESVERPAPSRAEAAGLRPPPLTAEQTTGTKVANALASQALDAKIAAYEKFQKEKAEFEKAREDEIWARVTARQRAAI